MCFADLDTQFKAHSIRLERMYSSENYHISSSAPQVWSVMLENLQDWLSIVTLLLGFHTYYVVMSWVHQEYN